LRLPPPRLEIAIEENLLGGDYLAKICREAKRRVAIVADVSVKTVGEKLKRELSAELFLFDGKEASKTRETKQRLEDELLQKRFGRDTLLIAVGGGVATDLTGFLASTYMRGVPLILVPTTLLAMVDAAVGGKTGVDTPAGKNLIGSLYFPIAIAIDPSVLQSLPEAEWLNGLAEILKYGLISDETIWSFCEERSWKKNIAELILASLRAKMNTVEKDPDEKGLRRILNFGHTTAHAIEQASRYQIPHGLAVAIGCQAESFLSCHLGYLSEETLERILALYQRLGFPRTAPHAFSKKEIFGAMQLDKKGKEGLPRFVLIDRIGNTLPFDGEYCRKIEAADFDALAEFLELRHG
jgi:3-dehydroquinate synthase